jgi:dTDP-4-dehydrorhamnose reductase
MQRDSDHSDAELRMILVTGASGLLGASILVEARKQGQRVAGISNRHAFRLSGVDALRVDLEDFDATRRTVAGLRPASIIHCAAATNVDWCEDHQEQVHRLNVGAAGLLAELAAELGVPFLLVSTDSVFDGEKGNYSEEDPPAPLNVYARSKLEAEAEVSCAHPSPLIVRVNIYGWNAQEKKSLAEWVLGELSAGNQVPGFADIHFSPMLVNHLAEILLGMLDRGLSGVYHVVGAESISKYEFARRVAVTFGLDREQVVEARASEGKLRAARPRNTSLCTEKICKDLGKAMPGVDCGLRKFRALRAEGYVQQLKSYLAEA